MTIAPEDDQADVRLRSVQREVRILMLLECAERAGISPLSSTQLHALAYLVNVLAPVWDLVPENSALLKLRGGPYYPELQADVDRLTAKGLLTVENTSFVQAEDGAWRLEGLFSPATDASSGILHHAKSFDDEQRIYSLVLELCLALSALDSDALVATALADATYSNPGVSFGREIDFSRWGKSNASAELAAYFEYLMPASVRSGNSENIHLYVSYLQAGMVANG